MLLDNEGSYLELCAVATRCSTRGFPLDFAGMAKQTLRPGGRDCRTDGVHVRINDILADSSFLRQPESPVNIRSLMCFPFVHCGEILGVPDQSQGEARFLKSSGIGLPTMATGSR